MTKVHLVRHGEVENPRGIIYGRLPGYNLSERGQRQAGAAADRLAGERIGAVWSSPLERAQETAAAIASPHALEVVTDDRITETETTLEGFTRSLFAFFRSPRHWWHFRNPMRPSWGESFADIRIRMMAAVGEALEAAGGNDAVVVSHQTPVLVARLALTQRRLPPWVGLTPCETGSVTSLEMDGARAISAIYWRPRV